MEIDHQHLSANFVVNVCGNMHIELLSKKAQTRSTLNQPISDLADLHRLTSSTQGWCAIQFEPAETLPISKALRGECHKCCHTAENGDEELAEVVRGWPRLAGPLRAAVLAIVRSQTGERK